MEIAVTGLAGAMMWTDTISLDDAAATQRITVPADATQTVRAYVAVPTGVSEQSFSFVLTALDEQRESDTVETLFNAPGDQ